MKSILRFYADRIVLAGAFGVFCVLCVVAAYLVRHVVHEARVVAALRSVHEVRVAAAHDRLTPSDRQRIAQLPVMQRDADVVAFIARMEHMADTHGGAITFAPTNVRDYRSAYAAMMSAADHQLGRREQQKEETSLPTLQQRDKLFHVTIAGSLPAVVAVLHAMETAPYPLSIDAVRVTRVLAAQKRSGGSQVRYAMEASSAQGPVVATLLVRVTFAAETAKEL